MAQQRRIQLHNLLKSILGSDNVYFQTPESQNIQYPAIVYELETVDTSYAGDSPYKINNRYQVTYIDRSPDSDIPRRIQELPMSRFKSYFSVDGLNHYNHSIYF